MKKAMPPQNKTHKKNPGPQKDLHIFQRIRDLQKDQALPFWSEGGSKARTLIAVSGGADSVFLFHFLHWLYQENGPDPQKNISVIHCQHGLRKNDFQDSDLVQALCAKHGIPFNVMQLHVPDHKKKGESIEMAARRLRYQAFAREMQSSDSQVLALGHHADDQAETILMRLGEGTGPDGLCGMRLFENQIWRPLLVINKDEIQNFLTREKIAWIEDMTNRDPKMLRNQMRQIMPSLKKIFPRFLPNILHLSAVLQSERFLINSLVNQWLQENSFYQAEKEAYLFSFGAFKELHPVLGFEVMKHLSLKVHESLLNRNFFMQVEKRLNDFTESHKADSAGGQGPQIEIQKNIYRNQNPVRTFHLFQDKYRRLDLLRFDFSEKNPSIPEKGNIAVAQSKENFQRSWFFSIGTAPMKKVKGIANMVSEKYVWQKEIDLTLLKVRFLYTQKFPWLSGNQVNVHLKKVPGDENGPSNLNEFLQSLEIEFAHDKKESPHETFPIETADGKVVWAGLKKIQKESLPREYRGLLPVLKSGDEILALLYPLLTGIQRPVRYAPILKKNMQIELEVEILKN
jgi:tRNA(Ile)-lysidine synthetase-like protein